MKKVIYLVATLAVAGHAIPVLADHDEDERRHKYKEEYWEGNCKVKRKFDKKGNYKEERKCKGEPQYSQRREPVYAPAPRREPDVVVVQPRAPQVVIEAPSVTVRPPQITIR